jgi:hypothetical protein
MKNYFCFELLRQQKNEGRQSLEIDESLFSQPFCAHELMIDSKLIDNDLKNLQSISHVLKTEHENNLEERELESVVSEVKNFIFHLILKK